MSLTIVSELLIFQYLYSRSQCVINITCGPKNTDGVAEHEPNNAVLTIVDLAGAEREKKTGNQVCMISHNSSE